MLDRDPNDQTPVRGVAQAAQRRACLQDASARVGAVLPYPMLLEHRGSVAAICMDHGVLS
jgi:hypothetical protein